MSSLRTSICAFYLTQLQRHADQVATSAELWLPWNYRATLMYADPGRCVRRVL
jgi:hypothetical protein